MGKKRIGIVLDYGRAADNETGASVPEPKATCAVVDPKDSSQQVLAAVTSVRAEKGMVCGIDGVPGAGCGVKVANPPAEADAADTPVSIPVVGAGSTPNADAVTSNPAQPAAPSPGTAIDRPLLLLIPAAVGWAIFVSIRRRRPAQQ